MNDHKHEVVFTVRESKPLSIAEEENMSASSESLYKHNKNVSSALHLSAQPSSGLLQAALSCLLVHVKYSFLNS